MRNRTRLTLVAILATAAAACMIDRPDPTPSGPVADAAVQAAVDADPRIIRAGPAATNYTPAWWTLEPGDRISTSEWNSLNGEGPDSHWGWGVVWVVSESGLGGATPFGAWFKGEKGPAPGEPERVLRVVTLPDGRQHRILHNDSHKLYLGHFPVRGQEMPLWDFIIEWDPLLVSDASLPPSLRGVVDPMDHVLTEAYNDRRRSFGSRADFLEAERKRYYAPGASW